MRLKQELHWIIGGCAALTLVVLGATGWWEARRVHLLAVEARGKAMALQLARACAVALSGPNEGVDLKYLLTSPSGDEEHRLVSVGVYETKSGRWVARQGATSREYEEGEDYPLLREALELEEGEGERVLSAVGETFGRRGPEGEDLLEFAALITDRSGVRRGVLTLSMVREPGGFLFLRTIALMIGVGSVVVGVLWLLLYKTLEGRILRPILKLSQGIQEVRAGNLGVHVEQTRRDEVGMVVESFNELIGILVERDSLQKRLEEARRLEEAHMRLNEAHRQLKSAQEQLILNEKHASLGRLVHGLNHELNNPLSAAKNMIPPLHNAVKALREGLVSRLSALDGSGLEHSALESASDEAALAQTLEDLDEGLSEEFQDVEEAVKVISRSVQRAINIIRDMGHFSKLGTADLQEVVLEEVVGEAAAACADELGPDGRVELTLNLAKERGEDGEPAPLRLRAFPNLLTQVFVNLITNSAQAIEGEGTLTISAKRAGEEVRVLVEDTGPGIPKEHLHKVFEPFFTTKEQGKGTGLGLAICMGFVERHGGTIKARRRRRGACFQLTLPVEPVLDEEPLEATTAGFLSASR